jgi:hypothetical protein
MSIARGVFPRAKPKEKAGGVLEVVDDEELDIVDDVEEVDDVDGLEVVVEVEEDDDAVD